MSDVALITGAFVIVGTHCAPRRRSRVYTSSARSHVRSGDHQPLGIGAIHVGRPSIGRENLMSTGSRSRGLRTDPVRLTERPLEDTQ